MGIVLKLFFSLALLISAAQANAAVPVAERNALVALYNSANGAKWTNKTGWLGAAGTECNWFGVACDTGAKNVISLRLNNNNLIGTIPPILGQLSKLQNLYLGENKLSGSLPKELGQLLQLQEFHLNSNQFSGSIPVELGKLSQLLYLDLYNNQISGSIPATFGQLSRLQTLYLDGNKLSGNIPAALGQLSQLLFLHLDTNELAGTIPTELGQLTKLVRLYLHYNKLSGSIPVSLTRLTNLQAIRLMGNNCLTTTDAALIKYLDQKDPNWKTQNCPVKPALTLAPTPTPVPTPAPIVTLKDTNVIPAKGVAPLTVTLDADGIFDAAERYEWRSEVIGAAKISPPKPTIGKLTSMTFNDAGTFNIILKATDKQGKSVSATKQIIVAVASGAKSPSMMSLLINVPKTERVLEADKVDWYRFYGQKGVTYKLEIAVGEGISPLVELFNAADKPMASVVTKTGESILVQGSLPADGYYKLKITNKNPIVARSLPKPSNHFNYALQVLLVDNPKTVIGKIRNSCTGNPVNDVQISVVSNPWSYTASLSDGEFSLPIDSKAVKGIQTRSAGRINFRRNDFKEAELLINTDNLDDVEIQLTPEQGCETVKAKTIFNCAARLYSENFYNATERYENDRFIRDYDSGWSLIIGKNDVGFAYKAPGMQNYNAQYSLDFINTLHCKPKGAGY
ncbi:MAG: hypothetical protein ABL903_01245 [Methylococcales bacterium]